MIYGVYVSKCVCVCVCVCVYARADLTSLRTMQRDVGKETGGDRRTWSLGTRPPAGLCPL